MVVVYVGLCWFIVVLYWFMASIMYCRAYEWNAFTYFLLLVVWFILMGQKFCFEANLFCQETSKTPAVSSREAIEACHHPTTRHRRVFILQKFDQVELNWRLQGIHIQLQSHLEPAWVGRFCIGISPNVHLFEVSWNITECLIPLCRMVRYRKKTHIKPTYPLVS